VDTFVGHATSIDAFINLISAKHTDAALLLSFIETKLQHMGVQRNFYEQPCHTNFQKQPPKTVYMSRPVTSLGHQGWRRVS